MWSSTYKLCHFYGRHYWDPWPRQSWMSQRTLWRKMHRLWTLSSGSEAPYSCHTSRSLSRCEGGPWAWLWPRPHPSPCLWQPPACRRWCLWWPHSVYLRGEGSIRWRPTSTPRSSPPYELNPRWNHINASCSVICMIFNDKVFEIQCSVSTQGSVKLHCQRSPLLYADRQPDLKSDVTGFNEILLEKTL